MKAIWEAVVNIYAALALVPYLSFAVIWGAVYGFTRNKKQTTRAAMDATFLLLIGSVAYMVRDLTGSLFLFWSVVLLMLVSAGFIGREQNRKNGFVHVAKLAKWVSRTGFLLFSFLYILLVAFSIGRFFVDS